MFLARSLSSNGQKFSTLNRYMNSTRALTSGKTTMAPKLGAISQTKPVLAANHSMSPSFPQYKKMGPSRSGPTQCSELTRYRWLNLGSSEKLKWSSRCSKYRVSYWYRSSCFGRLLLWWWGVLEVENLPRNLGARRGEMDSKEWEDDCRARMKKTIENNNTATACFAMFFTCSLLSDQLRSPLRDV